MRVQMNRFLTVMLTLACIVIAVVSFFSTNGYQDMKEFQSDLAVIEAENRQLQLENGRLSRQIRRLKEDKAYLDYLARKELGMVRPNDVILQFNGAGAR